MLHIKNIPAILLFIAGIFLSPTRAFSQAGLGEGLLVLTLTPLILLSDGEEAEKNRAEKTFEVGLGGSIIDSGISLDAGFHIADQTLATGHFVNFRSAYQNLSGPNGERFEAGIRHYFLGKFYLEAGVYVGEYRLSGYDFSQLPYSYSGDYRRIRSDRYQSGGAVGRAGMNWSWKFVYVGLEAGAFKNAFSKNKHGENMDALPEKMAFDYRKEAKNMYNKRVEAYMTFGVLL